jgi:hypothetical protein
MDTYTILLSLNQSANRGALGLAVLAVLAVITLTIIFGFAAQVAPASV